MSLLRGVGLAAPRRDPAWTATANNDLTTRAQPTLPSKPAYLGSVTDPSYGTKIVRVSGDPGTAISNITGATWGNCVTHHYNLDQSWNADESVLLLETNVDPNSPISLTTSAATTSSNVLNFTTNSVGSTTVSVGYVVADTTTPGSIPGGTTVTAVSASTVTISSTVTVASGNTITFTDNNSPNSYIFVDGSTYSPLYHAQLPGSGDARWHPTDPTKMIYVDSTSIGYFVPSTNTTTQVHTFTGYTGCGLGNFKGFPTLAPNPIVPIFATRSSDSALVMFSWDLSSSTKSTDIVITGATSCQIAPSGKYLAYTDGTTDFLYIYDRSAGTLVQGPWGASNEGAPSHSDVTLDFGGNDVFCGSDRTNNGILIARRMSDGVKTNLSSTSINNYVSHTSTRSVRFPGYAVASYSGFTDGAGSYPLYLGELIAARIDGSRNPYRLCHHFCEHGTNTDFYAYPFASISPTGTRIIFNSNWNNPNGSTRPMQCYVCDLR